MLTPNQLTQLAKRLNEQLDANEQSLLALSMTTTNNSLEATKTDLAGSRRFLDGFTVESMPAQRKAKGTVLVMLSFNEPLLLSVVPIFCALATGNSVLVRPSSKNTELFKQIWADVITDCQLDMGILTTAIKDIETVVQQVRAVYFFGSHAHARLMYQLCAKHYVEFFPEVETADVKVLHSLPDGEAAIANDIRLTLQNAFEHNGKMCQRISGLYVHQELYASYLAELNTHLANAGFQASAELQSTSNEAIVGDIRTANAATIYAHANQWVVVEPAADSALVKNAYFNESLWIRPYSDETQLLHALNDRMFFMGLNIVSQSQEFIDELIAKTNFSRYTLTDNHCDISRDSGWGGNWPSGSGGYKTWYEAFTNAYVVVGSSGLSNLALVNKR